MGINKLSKSFLISQKKTESAFQFNSVNTLLRITLGIANLTHKYSIKLRKNFIRSQKRTACCHQQDQTISYSICLWNLGTSSHLRLLHKGQSLNLLLFAFQNAFIVKVDFLFVVVQSTSTNQIKFQNMKKKMMFFRQNIIFFILI